MSGETFVHVLNSRQYRAVTGQDPPPTPVTPELYTSLGLPWFALYDEHLGDVPAGKPFGDVKSLREREEERGEDSGEQSVNVSPDQIVPIPVEQDTKPEPQ
jgi:hypothetical protein